MAAAVATNPRGIPVAPFVADPNDFLKDGETVETLLEKFAERNQKYKFMETQLQMKKKSLKSKIPDITATLEMVRYLKQRCDAGETFKTDFELCDTVFAEATIAPTDKVCLWLGANVMLEYDVAEADGLLQKKPRYGHAQPRTSCRGLALFARPNYNNGSQLGARVQLGRQATAQG
eukprot:Opistho-2@95983